VMTNFTASLDELAAASARNAASDGALPAV
jgi:hypothetical protein